MYEERLAQAVADIEQGRVPVPHESDIFVGDGSYFEIGAEFLRYFVEIGGLCPTDTVLDIGSGIGRMTSGLSRYLDPEVARYIGFDPVRKGIEWCREAYSHLTNFRFEWIDLYNELYNPNGQVLATELSFPCDTASIDFAVATSVFTHLYEPEIAAYFSEIARVLKPSGRLFSTVYLFDDERPPSVDIRHLRFDKPDDERPYRWHVTDMPPLSAVCYSEKYFRELAAQLTGREVDIRAGKWRGGAGPWFQDLCLLW